jgi:hypothetical protein
MMSTRGGVVVDEAAASSPAKRVRLDMEAAAAAASFYSSPLERLTG